MKGLSESPAALNSYVGIMGYLGDSTLTPAEQQLVFIAISTENECDYCVAAHTGAATAAKAPAQAIQALRDGAQVDDPRLRALTGFARAIVRDRGWVNHAELEQFLAAGYTHANVLDIVTAVAVKTISNYTNHIIDTPLDAALKRFAWQPKKQVA